MSERERFFIESRYNALAVHNLEKTRRIDELWARAYPRDTSPTNGLGNTYALLGQHDRALAEYQESVRRDPARASFTNLSYGYLRLNRFAEARALIDDALKKNPDSAFMRMALYTVAFFQNDRSTMVQEVSWGTGKPRVEAELLADEADMAAYLGQLSRARDFTRRAIASAEDAGEREVAAEDEGIAALREAHLGNGREAKKRAESALLKSSGRNTLYTAALALAVSGNLKEAEIKAAELARQGPEDTLVLNNYLPTLRSQIALSGNYAAKAIEALEATAGHELSANIDALKPIYMRGQAYLAAHRGAEASIEFQKIIDHRGLVFTRIIGALAHLQIGRAYTLQGDTAKARAAYQDFLTLWKDADPDIPILKQAKAEYAKLQ